MTTKPDTALMPCPLCGRVATYYEKNKDMGESGADLCPHNPSSHWHRQVQGVVCGTFMDSCGLVIENDGGKESIIKRWNTRTPATAPAGEPELVEAVARGIAISIYRTDGLETMNYAGEDDYANREWQHYEVQAKAALAIAREAIEGPLKAENKALREAFIGIKNCVDKGSPVDMLCDLALTTPQASGKE